MQYDVTTALFVIVPPVITENIPLRFVTRICGPTLNFNYFNFNYFVNLISESIYCAYMKNKIKLK